MYPRLVAGAVMSAYNVASQHFTREGVRSTGVRELLTDAMRQIAAGLPPP
jgi:hypothetical protein